MAIEAMKTKKSGIIPDPDKIPDELTKKFGQDMADALQVDRKDSYDDLAYIFEKLGTIETDIAAVSSVVAGTIIIWDGANCPTGYIRVAALDGKMLQANSSYNAAAGGSDTHLHSHTHGVGSYTSPTTGSHTLTTSEIPAHTHTVDASDSSGSDKASKGGAGIYTFNTSSTGGGLGHTHTGGAITGTSASDATLASTLPVYATILLCKKD